MGSRRYFSKPELPPFPPSPSWPTPSRPSPSGRCQRAPLIHQPEPAQGRTCRRHQLRQTVVWGRDAICLNMCSGGHSAPVRQGSVHPTFAKVASRSASGQACPLGPSSPHAPGSMAECPTRRAERRAPSLRAKRHSVFSAPPASQRKSRLKRRSAGIRQDARRWSGAAEPTLGQIEPSGRAGAPRHRRASCLIPADLRFNLPVA